MPSADVVVVGAGVAGLTAAIELASRGASVRVVAKGMAATHWTHGGIDVAAPPGTPTSADGLAALRRHRGHPYRMLHADVHPALDAHLGRLGDAGLPYRGDLETPLRPVPTAIGGLRLAAILPVAQAAAAEPWEADEGLLLVGFDRFRDAWPGYAARNLRAQAWHRGPSRIVATHVELAGLAGLRNLNGLVIARLFDRPAWRADALAAIARAVPPGRWRVGVPAVLGLERHAEVYAEAVAAIGQRLFEMPSLPPSIPGVRLFDALRRRAEAAGTEVQVGFEVMRVLVEHGRVTGVETRAAARPLRTTTRDLVLATGGLAGGGLRAGRDGRILEPLLDLPVSAPPREEWLAGSLYGAEGAGLEGTGIVVDEGLRPIDPGGEPVLANVRVVGAALAGMRPLAERCGDGVALASAHRAARLLSGGGRPRRRGGAGIGQEASVR